MNTFVQTYEDTLAAHRRNLRTVSAAVGLPMSEADSVARNIQLSDDQLSNDQ